MAKFHFSSYWQTWSRVLSENDPHGPFVELNLTPIHSWMEEVVPVRVRYHGTARDSRDIETDDLPESVRERMVKSIGPALTKRLLTEDFLPQIDYGRYQLATNGGANLEDIRIEPSEAPR